MVHQIVDAFNKMNVQEELKCLESEKKLYQRFQFFLDYAIGDMLMKGDVVHAEKFQKYYRDVFVVMLNAAYYYAVHRDGDEKSKMASTFPFSIFHCSIAGRLYRIGKVDAAQEFLKMEVPLAKLAKDVSYVVRGKWGDIVKHLKDEGLGQYILLPNFSNESH